MIQPRPVDLTRVDIALIQEALMVLLRDKYCMPTTFKEFQEKNKLVVNLWNHLEFNKPLEQSGFNLEPNV